MLHLLSTLVLVLIAAGIACRKRLRVHLALMISAFAMDLGLVIYIEATRHAVEKVVHHTGWLLWFHVLVSVAVLCAYVCQIQLGRRILAGFVASRQLHIK